MIKTSSCGVFENVRVQDWGILIRGIRAHQKYFLANFITKFPLWKCQKKSPLRFFPKILNSNKKREK